MELESAGTVDIEHGRRLRVRSIVIKIVIVAIVAVVYVSVRNSYDFPLRGDEPHYLIVTNSLILDGDFDVRNDYLEHRYFPYYNNGVIDPHVNLTIFTEQSPHWYPLHGVGLSVFLVPFVKAWGIPAGPKAAMIAVALLCVFLSYAWARRFTSSELAAWVAALTLGLSPAFLGLEGRVFPDLVTATLLVACLLIVEGRRGTWQLLLLGSLAGASAWVHMKFLPAFALALLVALVRILRSGDPRSRRMVGVVATVTPFVLSLGWLALTSHRWYGSWSPTSAIPPGNELLALSPFDGFMASAFDGTKGLFTSSPALLLTLFGLPLWARRFRASFLRTLVIVGPMLLLHATFKNWWAGYAPTARYALQFMPALVPAIALALDRPLGRLRVSLAVAVIWVQTVLAIRFVQAAPPWTIVGMENPLYHSPKGIAVHFDRLMPVFDQTGGLASGRGAVYGWTAIAIALIVSGVLVAARGDAEVEPTQSVVV